MVSRQKKSPFLRSSSQDNKMNMQYNACVFHGNEAILEKNKFCFFLRPKVKVLHITYVDF